MRLDTFRAFATYGIAVLILVGGFYTLVINEYVLDDLVKGATIGFMSAAISFVFGQEIAKATATATTKALNAPPPNTLASNPPNMLSDNPGGTP